MAVVNASQKGRTVADPCPAYDSVNPLWLKSRAVCNGERFVKDYDSVLDPIFFSNLLIPFSNSMTQDQYNVYKAEAELPGIVSQYSRTIVGGLLRKQPQLKLPKGVPEEAYQWIMDAFSQDSSPLVSFLDTALWEELQTSRVWIYVDYPNIPQRERDAMTSDDFRDMKPYPVIWKAEAIINWKLGTPARDGNQKLERVIVRDYEESYKDSEFHPTYLDTVWVHELVNGYYQIRKFQKKDDAGNIPVVNGQIQQRYSSGNVTQGFDLVETITGIEANGERLTVIPAWPLNGTFDPIEPMMTPLIDRELALYNKISRRNHLLYGAATYTPYICSDMSDEQFEDIVGAGLGSWFKLGQNDTAAVLETPTGALADMDRAIAATIEEMARMGIRMLSPETDQSGVALDIRNAAQTAQLGTLNLKISNQLADIIAFMLNWRYDLKLTSADIEFELSADFNPTPLGADWLRLATEWYQQGLIPRSLWVSMIKQNDMIPPDYDDVEGQSEILTDSIINNPSTDPNYLDAVQRMAGTDPDLALVQKVRAESAAISAAQEMQQQIQQQQALSQEPQDIKE